MELKKIELDELQIIEESNENAGWGLGCGTGCGGAGCGALCAGFFCFA